MTPLHHIGEWFRQMLEFFPIPAVRILFVASFVALLVWVLRLPESVTTPPGGAKRWDENLKIGACIALTLQIIIYAVL